MASSKLDANGCPFPPMEHLKAGASSTLAVAAAAKVGNFDRKGGNPGPQVAPFGVPGKQAPENPPELQDADVQTDSKIETKVEAEKLANVDSPENAIRREVLPQLAVLFPHVKEDWLEKCIDARMIADKWDLQKTASWIFDYENVAPRKETKRKFTGDFSGANDYNSIKAMLKDVKHETTPPEYAFYSSLKLSQKFPQFSMYSLRQILHDFNYVYPATVFAIVEGLEKQMMQERKTWKDWKRHEIIWIKVQRDQTWYEYPLCVVKGVKTWSKKKARMTPFPDSLTQEVRLVEKALYFYEQKCHVLLSKLDAEAARRSQLQNAVEIGVAAECPICFDDYLPEEQVACTDGHEYCVACLHRSVDEALNGQLKLSPYGDVPCLVPGCAGLFTLSMLCHLLPGDRLTKFEERIWFDFLAKAELPNLFTCFACGYAEEIDAPMTEVKLFECRNPKCKRKWCRSCRNLWDNHIGRTCKEMAGDPEEELRRKFDDMMSEVVIRRCMKCNRSVQKVQGCNKVTCQCGGKMCYLCRKPIEGYEHFCRHPTNPGESCGSCSSCKLWDDPEKIDNELRRKLQMQMQEELFEMRLAYAGKKAAQPAATPKTPTSPAEVAQPKPPATPQPPAPQPAAPQPPAGVAPQQRQFAAIFGGP